MLLLRLSHRLPRWGEETLSRQKTADYVVGEFNADHALAIQVAHAAVRVESHLMPLPIGQRHFSEATSSPTCRQGRW